MDNKYVEREGKMFLVVRAGEESVSTEIPMEFADEISKFRWYYRQIKGASYGHFYIGGGGFRLHQLIAQLADIYKEGHDIHHRDGNGLNNRLDNLEVLTPEEHQVLHRNRGLYAGSKSGIQNLSTNNYQGRKRFVVQVHDSTANKHYARYRSLKTDRAEVIALRDAERTRVDLPPATDDNPEMMAKFLAGVPVWF